MAKTVEPEERKNRRDVLRALGAAAAGAVAGSMLPAKEARASHGTLNITSATGNPAIHGENTGSGTGVEGTSQSGSGVLGASQTRIGVDGRSDSSTGVSGASISGTGVDGGSDSGIGVDGTSLSGTGVLARSPGGVAALRVEGKAMFSTSGAGTIAATQDSAVVSDATVTALSHITVTLTGDPGQAGRPSSAPRLKPVVVWVERQPGTGFVVHMDRAVQFNTPFTYLIDGSRIETDHAGTRQGATTSPTRWRW